MSVGWSTGGQLAMSLAWTSALRGVRPPEAILAFYCPTGYEVLDHMTLISMGFSTILPYLNCDEESTYDYKTTEIARLRKLMFQG